jgi:hypothetical protein
LKVRPALAAINSAISWFEPLTVLFWRSIPYGGAARIPKLSGSVAKAGPDSHTAKPVATIKYPSLDGITVLLRYLFDIRFDGHVIYHLHANEPITEELAAA